MDEAGYLLMDGGASKDIAGVITSHRNQASLTRYFRQAAAAGYLGDVGCGFMSCEVGASSRFDLLFRA